MLLPHLITFPRSGSHYFAKLVHEKTMFNIQRSHSVNISFDSNNNKTKKIITIARDPKDTITSLIALQKIQGMEMPDSKINELITYYIMFYNFLFQEADYVLDFKDLVSIPDTVIGVALGLLGIDEESYINFPDDTDYDAKGLAKGSSKIIPSYNAIKLDSFNMDLAYLYYNKLLSRSIKFNEIE
jgi:hypothetical protein